MNYEDFIIKSQNLYEKIFNETVENSIEYTIFAQGNFNPLRLKIETTLEAINFRLNETLSQKERQFLLKQRDAVKDLDAMLMEYIEENIN